MIIICSFSSKMLEICKIIEIAFLFYMAHFPSKFTIWMSPNTVGKPIIAKFDKKDVVGWLAETDMLKQKSSPQPIIFTHLWSFETGLPTAHGVKIHTANKRDNNFENFFRHFQQSKCENLEWELKTALWIKKTFVRYFGTLLKIVIKRSDNQIKIIFIGWLLHLASVCKARKTLFLFLISLIKFSYITQL
jgi:hypothetical protein